VIRAFHATADHHQQFPSSPVFVCGQLAVKSDRDPAGPFACQSLRRAVTAELAIAASVVVPASAGWAAEPARAAGTTRAKVHRIRLAATVDVAVAGPRSLAGDSTQGSPSGGDRRISADRIDTRDPA
jgi:hypothetical protein